MHRLGMNLCCVETLPGIEAFNLAAPFKRGKARREKNKNDINEFLFPAIAGSRPIYCGKCAAKKKNNNINESLLPAIVDLPIQTLKT